jgi:hypothetical protein
MGAHPTRPCLAVTYAGVMANPTGVRGDRGRLFVRNPTAGKLDDPYHMASMVAGFP